MEPSEGTRERSSDGVFRDSHLHLPRIHVARKTDASEYMPSAAASVRGKWVMSASWQDRRRALRALPTPLSADLPPTELHSPAVRAPASGRPIFGVATRDVPLLVIPGHRLEFDYGEPVDFDTRGPLESLGVLASTQTGFMPHRTPDYRFPHPLAGVVTLCDAASTVYAREDERSFRNWLHAEFDVLAARAGTSAHLIELARSLSLPRQEMLMVPLIYLNHMWRQGSPIISPASGPSAMPVAFDSLLTALAESTGILPRFNQLLMTMRAWRIEALPGGERVTYRDLADLRRIWPYFWLNGSSHSELEFYRAFFTVESLGIPAYGWGCLALECAGADDTKLGAFALRCIHRTLRNVYFSVRHLVPHVDPVEFRKIQLTGGWINDELNGAASGYQLPFTLMLDALFQVDYSHPGTIEARANGLRFVPKRWQGFFQKIREQSPALRTWVRRRGHSELTDAYQRCIELFTIYRTMHRHLAGQTLRGATTTGRAFPDSERNYRTFMSEIGALVADTAAVGIPATIESES